MTTWTSPGPVPGPRPPTLDDTGFAAPVVPIRAGRPPADEPEIVDLVAGDTATVAAVYDGLSPDSRYRRYQSSRPYLSPSVLRRLAAVRPGVHVVHVAVRDGHPVGLIRWIRWGAPGCAELAYEVVDAAQGRGVGSALLHRAIRSASIEGIEWFLVQVAAGDDALRRRLRLLGGQADPERPGFHRMPVRPGGYPRVVP